MYEGYWKFRGATNTWTEKSLDQPKSHGEMEGKAKEAVESVILANFVQKMIDGGIDDIVIKNYTTECKVVTVAARQYRDWTIFTYEIQVSIDLWFTTSHEIASSPISPAIIAAIILVIKYIIIAMTVGLVVYFVLTALVTRTSEVTVEYYDSEGNLVKKETQTTTEGALSGLGGGILIAVIAIFFVMMLLGGSFSATKKGVKIGK